jgi:dihydroorotate dehydrogenase (fumarate)
MAIDALDIHKPIWVKMPLNLAWLDFKKLLEVIAKHNVQAVTIGNLSKDRSGIPSTELPAEVAGNLSGLPTQALSDDLIRRTYEEYGKRLTIIGVGGIFSAEDAYRKICNGASLVALITGMIFEGPQLIGQINHDLVKLLKEDGFKNISEAVGSKVTSNI